jgi:hypothetical protein
MCLATNGGGCDGGFYSYLVLTQHKQAVLAWMPITGLSFTLSANR